MFSVLSYEEFVFSGNLALKFVCRLEGKGNDFVKPYLHFHRN